MRDAGRSDRADLLELDVPDAIQEPRARTE
jgi:hypothetical protein